MSKNYTDIYSMSEKYQTFYRLLRSNLIGGRFIRPFNFISMYDNRIKINIDLALEKYNEKNDRDVTKKDLALMLGTNPQNLTNYNGGRTPAIMNLIFNLHLISGVAMDELIVALDKLYIKEVVEGEWSKYLVVKDNFEGEDEVLGEFPTKKRAQKYIDRYEN